MTVAEFAVLPDSTTVTKLKMGMKPPIKIKESLSIIVIYFLFGEFIISRFLNDFKYITKKLPQFAFAAVLFLSCPALAVYLVGAVNRDECTFIISVYDIHKH